MKAVVLKVWNRDIANCLIAIGEEFIRETHYPITFSKDLVYDRLSDAFFSGEGDIIVARDDCGNFAGGAVVYATSDYQVEKFGYLEKFFVASEYRSEGVGRLIAQEVARWFDEKDCLFSFATSTANIGTTGLFTNLMAKYGYQNIGPTLTRGKNHGKV